MVSSNKERTIEALKHSLGKIRGIKNGLYGIMNTNKPKIIGIVNVKHFRNNELLSDNTYRNVITNTGLAEVAGLINGVTSGPFQYLAIGTGTTNESITDTALESEITSGGGERALADASRTTTSITNDTAVLTNTWTFTSSFAVSEAGIFDASSGGVMLSRKTIGPYNVTSGDSIQLTWKIIVSRS